MKKRTPLQVTAIRLKSLLLMVCLLLAASPAFSQTKTVTGKVVDGIGEPLIGVTVQVEGTGTGVITDIDGNYSVGNVPDDATLIFSYVGMLSQKISVSGQSVINVTMQDDTQQLEEVVVIGYGSAKSKDLTAPIEVVKEAELINVPTSSPMSALQGKVAGVNITNSGTPGDGPKVTIRGNGSFSDTSPLYVVDGMFYDDIDFLNNADIQSMPDTIDLSFLHASVKGGLLKGFLFRESLFHKCLYMSRDIQLIKHNRAGVFPLLCPQGLCGILGKPLYDEHILSSG